MHAGSAPVHLQIVGSRSLAKIAKHSPTFRQQTMVHCTVSILNTCFMAIRGKLELFCAIFLPYEGGNSDAAMPNTKSLPFVYIVTQCRVWYKD